MLLWQNDLDGWNVICVWDWVIQDADSSNDLTNNLGLAHISNVGWVTDNKWGLGGLFTRADTNSFTALHKNLVDWGVQHVGTTVNGAKTGERLWETS